MTADEVREIARDECAKFWDELCVASQARSDQNMARFKEWERSQLESLQPEPGDGPLVSRIKADMRAAFE